MQLLCLVAMEPMVSFTADEIRNKKVDVLHAVRPIPRGAVHQCVVRGQFGGTHVKVMATGHKKPVEIPSGPHMTAAKMVAAVRTATVT